jgi:hypothetical protein
MLAFQRGRLLHAGKCTCSSDMARCARHGQQPMLPSFICAVRSGRATLHGQDGRAGNETCMFSEMVYLQVQPGPLPDPSALTGRWGLAGLLRCCAGDQVRS